MNNPKLELGEDEFYEIAREILAELDRSYAERVGSDSRGLEKPEAFHMIPTDEYEKYYRRIGLENIREAFRRKGSESGDVSVQGESPRGFTDDNAGHFRAAHSVTDSGGVLLGEASIQAERAAVRGQEFERAGIPERISALFCRDARRYDGAFERY